jgi:hypothetical protein
MKLKVLPITLFLLYSTFVSSQTEIQKAAFQNFRDSCNKELAKQFGKQEYDSVLRTLDVAQKRYNNLDKSIKKELNLEGKFFYVKASVYVNKNDEKSAVYFLQKAVKAGYKGLCSWQNLIYMPGKENIEFNNELIKLGELKRLSNPDTMSLPWHLIDIRTQLKNDVTLEKLEIDFSVLSDIPNDLNLYIAPLGFGFINGQGFYGGIQTKVHGTGKPGLIFSRWNERDTTAIQTDSVGYKCSSGDEGDFISVRKKFDWHKGKYKISLTAAQDTIMLRGKVHRWVTMSIYSYDAKQEVINGSLAFPGDTLMLNKELWMFVEIYGGFEPKIALKDIPEMQFSFDKFVVNGQEQVQSVEANYWIEYPKYANATYKDGKILLIAGKKFARINPKLKQGHYVETLFEGSNR